MRICKLEFVFLACAFFSKNLFCQTAPAAPIAPIAPMTPMTQLQMPQMPSISAPAAGSNFYVPGNQYLQNQKASEEKKDERAEKEKGETADTLEQFLGGVSSDIFSSLSAWDLSQLAHRGALGNISSLSALSDSTSNLGMANLNAANQQKVLTKILSELEQIKSAQSDLVAVAPVGAKPSSVPPKILRFSVNSKSIDCTQVFFSEMENDGSFLLTGDVKTFFQNETICETFYLLFAANGTSNSKSEYFVTPTLSQSKLSQTPLRQFCSAQNFTATRTGNLVMLHYVDGGNNYDLLLDVGSPSGAR